MGALQLEVRFSMSVLQLEVRFSECAPIRGQVYMSVIQLDVRFSMGGCCIGLALCNKIKMIIFFNI